MLRICYETTNSNPYLFWYFCRMIDLTLIKNIIFDLGGVLLNLDFNLTRKAFNNLGTIDFDDFYSKAKQNRLFDDFEIGAINEATFCDQLKKSANLNASN